MLPVWISSDKRLFPVDLSQWTDFFLDPIPFCFLPLHVLNGHPASLAAPLLYSLYPNPTLMGPDYSGQVEYEDNLTLSGWVVSDNFLLPMG